MASVSGQQRRKLMVALVVVAVFTIAIAYMTVSTRPAKPSQTAMAVASRLPANTSLLIWTASIEGLMEMVQEAGLDGAALAIAHEGFGRFVENLGANPMTVEGLRTLGVDTSGGLSLAVVPAAESGVILVLHVPLLDESTVLAQLEALLPKLGVGEEASVEPVTTGENAVARLSLGRTGGRTSGQFLLVPAEHGLFVLIPTRAARAVSGEMDQKMTDLARQIGRPTGDTLAQSSPFLTATAGTGGALLAAFLNRDASLPVGAAGNGNQPFLFWGLMGADGAAFSMVEDGVNLELMSRTLFPGQDDVLFGDRDLRALELVPGHPVAGLHLALDLRRTVSELERYSSHARLAAPPLVHGLLVPGPFGLPDQVKLIDLLTGEMGLFVGEISGEFKRLISSSTLFLGVTDIVDDALLAKILANISDPAQAAREGGANGVVTVSVLGSSLSFVLADGRLWVTGDLVAAKSIAAGQKGQLTTGDRSAKVAEVMSREGGLAVFLDLAQATDGLLELVADAGALEGPIKRLVESLDFLSGEMTVEGRTVVGRFALQSRGQSFRRATLPGILATVDGLFGARSERRKSDATLYDAGLEEAWQGEAQHNLHKLYYGAATYFETPPAGSAGLPVLCRFPDAAGVTPAKDCCAFPGGRCPADSQVWESSEAWRALNFSIASTHYCNYSFQSSNSGVDALFSATAWCDANCDGVFDVWRMEGRAGETTTDTFCEMSGARKFRKIQVGPTGESTPGLDRK